MSMTPREREIVSILKENPFISQEDLAKHLGITRSSTAVHLSHLMAKGIIAGRGYIVQDEPKVVVIGGINVDIKGQTFSEPIFHTSNPGKTSTTAGGVGRNIAENLARLDVPTILISLVGQDALGERVLSETRRAGVDVKHVEKVSGDTGTYTALLDPQGELLLALSAMDILEQLTPDFLRSKENILQSAHMIITDTNLPIETLDYLLTFTNKNDIPLIIEPVSMPKVAKLKALLSKHRHRLFLITPNREEAEALTGIQIQNDRDLKQAAMILNQNGVENILITLGSRGAYLFTEDQMESMIPASKVQVQEVTGAGDAFVAGIIYGLMNGHTLKKSCLYGHAAAGLTLTTYSTVNPDISSTRLEQFISQVHLLR